MSEFRNLVASFAFTGGARPAPSPSASSTTASPAIAVPRPLLTNVHDTNSHTMSKKRTASIEADMNLASLAKKARVVSRSSVKPAGPSKRTIRANDSSRFSDLKPLEDRLALGLDSKRCIDGSLPWTHAYSRLLRI